MRIGIPLFKVLKGAWDGAGLPALFPGGYIAGQRIVAPSAFPALSPWPASEVRTARSACGAYFTVHFEVGIVHNTFIGCGDEALTTALENATVGITASGPVPLNAKLRLIAIAPEPDAARYVEIPPDLFVCFLMFNATVSQ